MNIFKTIDHFYKLAQDVSLQPGDIADAFPQYFPKQGSSGSPLTQLLNEYVSANVPEDVSVKVVFKVNPGFSPDFSVTLSKAGKEASIPGIENKIKAFLKSKMSKFSGEASKKFPGKKITQPLEIATFSI